MKDPYCEVHSHLMADGRCTCGLSMNENKSSELKVKEFDPDWFPFFTDEEENTKQAILAARHIQEFLWGDKNSKWDFEEWKRMFRKRVAKLEEVDRSNPHADVEINKRLLQTAALAVALIAKIKKEGIPWDAKARIPSNLPQYALHVPKS